MKKRKNKKRTSNRNKAMCHATKVKLIEEYGYFCFICGRYDKEVQHHHCIPRYAGGSDNYENGSLICDQHHKHLHLYDYGTQEYTEIQNTINEYKQNNLKG